MVTERTDTGASAVDAIAVHRSNVQRNVAMVLHTTRTVASFADVLVSWSSLHTLVHWVAAAQESFIHQQSVCSTRFVKVTVR